MFLFKEQHVEMILDGRKTQTRRLHKRRRAKPDSLHWAQLNMNGSSRFARLRVKRAWQERLSVISDADVTAEGYADMAEYVEAFIRINGKKIRAGAFTDAMVWCYEFEVVSDDEA